MWIRCEITEPIPNFKDGTGMDPKFRIQYGFMEPIPTTHLVQILATHPVQNFKYTFGTNFKYTFGTNLKYTSGTNLKYTVGTNLKYTHLVQN